MSVIAWDGRYFVADRMASSGELKGRATKLHKSADDKHCFGFVGALDSGLMLKQWWERGARQDEWPAFQSTDNWCRLIVLDVFKRRVFTYERHPVAIPCEDKFDAWGSGCELAIGAMAAGASALRAVQIASQHCNTCGLGRVWMDLDKHWALKVSAR